MKFGYECNAHQITKNVVLRDDLGVQVKNFIKLSWPAVNNFGGPRVAYHNFNKY